MGRIWTRFYESLLAPSSGKYNEDLDKGLDLKSSRDLDGELACEFAAKLEGDSEKLAHYGFFSLLPDDVLMAVLVRLPVGCVFTCRMVCRRWRILTSSPDFLRLHCRYNHKENSGFFVIKAAEREVVDNEVQGCYIEEDWTIKTIHETLTRKLQPGFHVLYGSCNGLLLFTVNGTPPYICFWNPITQERLLFEMPSDGSNVCGFFFHEPTEDYRVLCVYKEENYFQYMMLSLHTRCWRKISGFTSHPYLPIAPVHAGGALCWLVARTVSCGTVVNCDEMIMLYDIDRDEFCTKNHPHHEPCGSAWHSFMWIEERSLYPRIGLSNMEGKLWCYIMVANGTFRLWYHHMLDGKAWCWKFSYTIYLGPNVERFPSRRNFNFPRVFSNQVRFENIINGEVLINIKKRGLFLYHLEHHTIQEIKLPPQLEGPLKVVSHTKSFAAIGDLHGALKISSFR